MHETPLSPLAVAPAGFGVFSIDQVVPFQRSASGSGGPGARLMVPTAVHSVGEVHETALSELPSAPIGLGADWTDQLVPFQRMANVNPFL